MKRLKKGFTLAEVLITLAIIGVVSAIIIPSVMANYQYKSIGVKLGKFMATVEAAARPYVVNNDNFSTRVTTVTEGGKKVTKTTSNVTDFINESFIFKSFDPEVNSDTDAKILEYPNITSEQLSNDYVYAELAGTDDAPVATLKDGTAIQVYLDDTQYEDDRLKLVPVEKYGKPVFRIVFDPKVQGLSSAVQKNFNFTVTELGYIFPSQNDNCAWELYENDFTTTSKSFDTNTACHISSTSAN